LRRGTKSGKARLHQAYTNSETDLTGGMSRKNCAFWRQCEREYGGTVAESCHPQLHHPRRWRRLRCSRPQPASRRFVRDVPSQGRHQGTPPARWATSGEIRCSMGSRRGVGNYARRREGKKGMQGKETVRCPSLAAAVQSHTTDRSIVKISGIVCVATQSQTIGYSGVSYRPVS